jgi:hypothetical protein
MGLTGCPETSVTNYQSTLCNISEEISFTLPEIMQLKAVAGEGLRPRDNWMKEKLN